MPKVSDKDVYNSHARPTLQEAVATSWQETASWKCPKCNFAETYYPASSLFQQAHGNLSDSTVVTCKNGYCKNRYRVMRDKKKWNKRADELVPAGIKLTEVQRGEMLARMQYIRDQLSFLIGEHRSRNHLISDYIDAGSSDVSYKIAEIISILENYKTMEPITPRVDPLEGLLRPPKKKENTCESPFYIQPKR